MKRDSVVIYRNFYEGLKGVNERSYKRVMNAVLGYAMDEIEPNLNGLEYAIFLQAKSQIDANNRKFKNGKQGGRPRNQSETNEEPNNNQSETKVKPNNNQSETKINQTETKPEPSHANEKCKMRNEICKMRNEILVSKKERKNNYLNKNNIAPARESYDEIMEKLQVSAIVRNKIWEFIQHCNLNGKILTNAKLEDTLIRLDMKYSGDEQAKVEDINTAISKGRFEIR